jgi:dTDP-4-dehydrorhamnose 3,5-epimerase
VPPGVWNGFMGLGTEEAIVINFTDIPHDPNEIHRCDPHENDIPYSWKIKDR